MVSQKRTHHWLIFIFFFHFKQHHPERKPLVPRDSIPTWVQRGKHWSVNPHPSTTATVEPAGQLGCLGPSLSGVFLPLFTCIACVAITLPFAFPSHPWWKLLFYSSTFGALVLNLCLPLSHQGNEVNRRASVECKLWMATFESVECSSSTMLSALQYHHNVQVSHHLECTWE